MADHYWRPLLREAWADTLKDLGFGTWRQGVKTAAPPVVLFILAFLALRQLIWAGAATVALSVLMLLPAFFVHSLLKTSRARTEAAEVDREIVANRVTQLEAEIVQLKAPPAAPLRDPDGIYQWDGVKVGRAVAANLDIGAGQAEFGSIVGTGEFNFRMPFEYREWQLQHFASGANVECNMGGITRTLHQVTCKVVGRRPGA